MIRRMSSGPHCRLLKSCKICGTTLLTAFARGKKATCAEASRLSPSHFYGSRESPPSMATGHLRLGNLIEAQPGKPAPRQMHAQFLHQLELAGYAVGIADHRMGSRRSGQSTKGGLVQSPDYISYASERRICLIMNGGHTVIHFFFRRRS
jgi:hypothetical protein